MDGDAYISHLNRWIKRESKRLAQRDPALFSISLHHLYYLLTRFDDLEVPIGPLNIRLDNSNYVSFSKSDAASIRSVASFRSVIGSWFKEEVDLKQLYSSFSMIPAVRICATKVQPIRGFEEYPFDTAVPLLAFKNLQFLEIHDYTPRAFYGWDEVSQQLKSLVVKRGISDVETLTINTIRNEKEKKARKAERALRHWQNVDSPRSRATSPILGRRPSITRTLTVNDTWRFLRFLGLPDNGLTSINAASLPTHLNFLDLSKNKFTNIPALTTLSSLRSLDLSSNSIASLHSLIASPLPAISTINLRSNLLSSIAGIERLPSLERIDLRDNKLNDVMEMARITAPNITEIWVAGNQLHDRIAIFNIFRSNVNMTEDVLLDGRRPGIIERRSLIVRPAEVQQRDVEIEVEQAQRKSHKSRIIDL